MAAESIYFSDNLTFCNSADCRIAAHLGNLIQIVSYQERRHTEPGRSCCSFTSGMAGTYNDNIVIKLHNINLLKRRQHFKRLIFMTFHNFSLSRPLIVDATEMENTMNDNTQ